MAAHFSPDGSLTINDGTPAVGRDAITEAALSFMIALPDIQVLMDDLVVEDGGIEFRWTFTGTNTGPGGTGNRVRVTGYEEWVLGTDGLIADSQGHYRFALLGRLTSLRSRFSAHARSILGQSA